MLYALDCEASSADEEWEDRCQLHLADRVHDRDAGISFPLNAPDMDGKRLTGSEPRHQPDGSTMRGGDGIAKGSSQHTPPVNVAAALKTDER